RSFGIEKGVPFNRFYPRSGCSLLWQQAAGRLLYIPKFRDFEIQAYAADGRSLGVFGAQGPRILPVRISDRELPLAQATGAASLPHSEIAVQREVMNFRFGRASRVVEFYDSRLRRRGIAESDLRDLAGAASDGDLYFTTLSPRGLQVFKVG